MCTKSGQKCHTFRNVISAVDLIIINVSIYYKQDTGNSCLNITNNQVDHYCSWLPYGGQTIRDTEIGMNASVAEALGLYNIESVLKIVSKKKSEMIFGVRVNKEFDVSLDRTLDQHISSMNLRE